MNDLEKIDALIRDITKVGFMPKSEARKRIDEIVSSALLSERQRIRKLLEDLKLIIIPPQDRLTGTIEFREGYNQALEDILKELK